MKLYLTVLAVICVVLGCKGQLAPLLEVDSKGAIPDEYVIQLTEDADLDFHLRALDKLIPMIDNSSRLLNTFSIGKTFKGYGAKLGDKMLQAVRAMENVVLVEPNQIYRASAPYKQAPSCEQYETKTWGIVRANFVNKPNYDIDFRYSYSSERNGDGVRVYILDTGIDTEHPSFLGRSEWGADFVDRVSPRTDENGHGTHVAGTVMALEFGMAPKATSVAVRVLDAGGSGSTTGIMDGISWVVKQGKPGVINMSLGGGKSTTFNSAVNAAVDSGVTVVVAAGNEFQDACNVSPASATGAITVGSTDKDDKFSYFSNYGKCVDILAPGSSITSTWPRGATNTISGTSMASPHVAGEVADYLTDNPKATPAQVKAFLLNNAVEGKIQDVPKDTPNRLLHLECF